MKDVPEDQELIFKRDVKAKYRLIPVRESFPSSEIIRGFQGDPGRYDLGRLNLWQG